MAKLSELVNVKKNIKTIKIQDVDIPVSFNVNSVKYIEEGYGKTFETFKKDVEKVGKKKFVLSEKEIKIIMSLVYSLVRSGGTECTYDELVTSIPMNELKDVFDVSIEVFNSSGLRID